MWIFLFLYKYSYFIHNIKGDIVEKSKYKELVNKHKPKENRSFNSIISFLTGGVIGLGGQILSEYYQQLFNIPMKDAVSLVLVTLIFLACLFTALGFFDKWVNFCRCGLIIGRHGKHQKDPHHEISKDDGVPRG